MRIPLIANACARNCNASTQSISRLQQVRIAQHFARNICKTQQQLMSERKRAEQSSLPVMTLIEPMKWLSSFFTCETAIVSSVAAMKCTTADLAQEDVGERVVLHGGRGLGVRVGLDFDHVIGASQVFTTMLFADSARAELRKISKRNRSQLTRKKKRRTRAHSAVEVSGDHSRTCSRAWLVRAKVVTPLTGGRVKNVANASTSANRIAGRLCERSSSGSGQRRVVENALGAGFAGPGSQRSSPKH